MPPGPEHTVPVDVSVKVAAADRYITQLGFQFGGSAAAVLGEIAVAEAARTGVDGPVEVFTVPPVWRPAPGCGSPSP